MQTDPQRPQILHIEALFLELGGQKTFEYNTLFKRNLTFDELKMFLKKDNSLFCTKQITLKLMGVVMLQHASGNPSIETLKYSTLNI